MAIFSWNGAANLDLKMLGQSFDFRSDVLQISDPSLQASQFDLVEVGTDLAIVKTRDASGAPLDASAVTYAYIPNMIIRQVGGTDASPVSSNIVLSNGGQLWVGDRLTDTILDDAGNDVTVLSSALQSVQVWGLGGADTITTGDGADRVYGNTGADNISGGAGNDSLYGGQENDTVSGGAGNDNVAGDLGNDMLNGGSGNDIIYGGAGNDVIDPDTGNDTIFAGNGNDTVSVGNSDTGNKLIYMDKMQDLVNIISTTGDHMVYLGENNDIANLQANAGDIQVFGDSGNDSIYAQNFGSDTLDGGNDDDTIAVGDGSIGQKTLIGGFGDDEIYVGDSSGNAYLQIQPNTQVTVSGGEGDDNIYYERGLFLPDANDGGADKDYIHFDGATVLQLRDKSIENIETVSFSSYSDAVVFADGNVAAGATMTVYGNSGEDFLDGSKETNGTFVLYGDFGNDTLIGGSGADTIIGGEGEDRLNGGGGKDVYVYNDDDEIGDLVTMVGGQDMMMFDGVQFGGLSTIIGYKGVAISGAGEDANVNLYIATGDNYTSLSDYSNRFLTNNWCDEGNRPTFHLFYNSSEGSAVLYWDDDSNNGVTDAQIVAYFTNIDGGVAGLQAIDVTQFSILV